MTLVGPGLEHLFWDSTPREVSIIADGVNERLRLEHNITVSAAYLAGTLPNAQNRPALTKLLIPKAGTRRRMTRAEIKDAMLIAFPPQTKKRGKA